MPLSAILEEAKRRGHSQAYIKDIEHYCQKLMLQGLPIIFTREHFSILLNWNPGRLSDCFDNIDSSYKVFKVRKKQGTGYRYIQSPSRELKSVQNWIKVNILDKIQLSDSVKGFRKGYSIIDNAKVHDSAELILNIDLYRFFESITENRVYGLFKWMGYHGNVARDLARLLCYKPSSSFWNEIEEQGVFGEDFQTIMPRILPQGSPASPAISNLICYQLDRRLASLAGKLGLNYSRYADDITFSGARSNMVSMALLKKIILDEGLYLNESKTKFLSKSRQQMVTGLVVNNGVHVCKSLKKEIFTHLYFARKKGVKNHLEWRSKLQSTPKIKANFRDYLKGKIDFVKSIEPQVGQKMQEQFNLVPWEI